MDIWDRDSVTVKNVEQLGLRPEVTQKIKELISQCEYPTVFWINAETDKNYAAIHPAILNEFWISIRRGTKKEEIERLCLSSLYKQVQVKRRYLIAQPTEYCLQLAGESSDKKWFVRMGDLFGEINSLSSTIESGAFIAQFGFKTSPDILQEKIRGTLKTLDEFLYKQEALPGFCWHRENEASNLMELAYCSSFGEGERKQIISRISKIKPLGLSLFYIKLINKTQDLIESFYATYDGSNGEECVNSFRTAIVRLYQLEKFVKVDSYLAYSSKCEQSGRIIQYYSFVPDETPHEEKVLFCVRSLNEALGLYKSLVLEKVITGEMHSVSVAYTMDGDNNCYAFGEKEYFLLISQRFVMSLYQEAEKRKGSMRMDQLIRFALFYIALHEYGHIVHGDCDCPCDGNSEEQQRREQEADLFADNNYYSVLVNQYRNLPVGDVVQELQKQETVFLAAKELALSLR